MSDKIKAVLPKIGPLLRRLTSSADNEVVSAAHLLLRVLAGAGLDIHALVDRIEHGGDEKLSATEMQQIYDQAYAKGHADGAEQGRRSAVIAAAMPMVMLDTSDIGPGVNGYSWLEIAHYCADNKHRVSRDRDREFIDSVFEQLASGRRPISPPQAKWLRDIFKQRFAGRID